MKGNKLVKLMAFVLLVTVLAIILVSGTYAKYTTSATGTDTAKVALWSIKINDKDIAKAETKELTVDLFSTITNTDGTDEKNVSAIDGSLIAPGTMGSFNLVSIENASEVNATYSVTYTLTGAEGIPLQFTTTKDNEDSWSNSLPSVNVTNADLKAGAKADGTKVYWRWAFDGNDETDTNLGTTTPTVTLKASVSVEQAN